MGAFEYGNCTRAGALVDRLHTVARLMLGLSHDLNNVFGALQSNVDILRRRLPGESPLVTNLNHLQHATDHATELIHILDIFTQHAKVELDTVNLPPLLSEAVKAFKETAPEACKVHVRPLHGNFFVSTCPAMLTHALSAILQNAVDALQGNPGAITVDSVIGFDRIHSGEGLLVGTMPPDGGALIEISDTGEGMVPEVLDHILEPFFSTRIRGRGLGLAPVAGLVFQCNAAVHITSTPGQGTTFRLLLPIGE